LANRAAAALDQGVVSTAAGPVQAAARVGPSNKALGIVLVDESCEHVLCWRLRLGWKCNGRDIGAAESWAFEAVCHHAVQLSIAESEGRLTHRVDVDNSGVHDAWEKGRSRSKATNATFIRMFKLMNEMSHFFSPNLVPRDLNRADKISRGELDGVRFLEFQLTLSDAIKNWAWPKCRSFANE
jgi:hypothetical protein